MGSFTSFLKQSVLFALVASFTSTFAHIETVENCATQLRSLEYALYETRNNVFELNRIFFPPSARTSRFIRVHYHFLNEMGTHDYNDCLITYIWAVGEFLFFQPPSLFHYNSLFFNFPNNNLTDLDLFLPYECRPLVHV